MKRILLPGFCVLCSSVFLSSCVTSESAAFGTPCLFDLVRGGTSQDVQAAIGNGADVNAQD
jgi:hypothetical protein